MQSQIANILTHKINFIENITQNALEQDNWQIKLSYFAQVKPLYDNKFGSIEKFTFGHLVTEAYFMFKIRYCSIIHNKMRIVLSGRIFEIKRIINIGEYNKIMQIIALELS